MIRFTGTRALPQPIAVVANKLSDASFLVSCIPDAQIVSSSVSQCIFKVRPKGGFLTGSIEIFFDVTGRDPGLWVDFRSVSKGMGGSSTLTSRLSFAVDGMGTVVEWAAEMVERTGMLKFAPDALIRSAAPKAIEEVWSAIEKKLHEFIATQPT